MCAHLQSSVRFFTQLSVGILNLSSVSWGELTFICFSEYGICMGLLCRDGLEECLSCWDLWGHTQHSSLCSPQSAHSSVSQTTVTETLRIFNSWMQNETIFTRCIRQRITKWLRLEGCSEIIYSQPPHHRQGCLSTRHGCPKPHPVCPWILPGNMHV